MFDQSPTARETTFNIPKDVRNRFDFKNVEKYARDFFNGNYNHLLIHRKTSKRSWDLGELSFFVIFHGDYDKVSKND